MVIPPKERGGTEKSHCEQQGTRGGHENVGFGAERGSKKLSHASPGPLTQGWWPQPGAESSSQALLFQVTGLHRAGLCRNSLRQEDITNTIFTQTSRIVDFAVTEVKRLIHQL